MPTPESYVKNQAKKLFKEEGIFYFMVVPSGYGRQGLPDFITSIPVTITEDMVGKTIGVFGGFEAKAPGKIKNTTANQRMVLEELHKAGAIAVVFDSNVALESAIGDLRKNGDADFCIPT